VSGKGGGIFPSKTKTCLLHARDREKPSQKPEESSCWKRKYLDGLGFTSRDNGGEGGRFHLVPKRGLLYKGGEKEEILARGAEED